MQVRVLRLLEYTGDLHELKEHLSKRGVQGTKRLSDHVATSTIVIREHILGDSVDVFEALELSAKINLLEAL